MAAAMKTVPKAIHGAGIVDKLSYGGCVLPPTALHNFFFSREVRRLSEEDILINVFTRAQHLAAMSTYPNQCERREQTAESRARGNASTPKLNNAITGL